MSARRLLVLGGSGTLGVPLSVRAVARGWDVMATYLTRADRVRAESVQLDLRDEAALRCVITSTQPDVVIHAAVTERSG